MSMEFILDGVITLFMAVLIVYCIVLNGRLKKFRNAQDEMAQMVMQLNEATTRAQQSIGTLKQSVGDEEIKLAELLDKARKMADELSVITDVGSNLANRLERGLLPDTDKGETPVSSAKIEEPEDEEDELLENLRNVR
ncbi:DUF6468 domain-containing protein [Emcibacter sp.]|uniref:DUF6468 domain-containing protein n=1 Tax=Emcibacter sp. TaxID=1979954 RepID=UPI003A90D850